MIYLKNKIYVGRSDGNEKEDKDSQVEVQKRQLFQLEVPPKNKKKENRLQQFWANPRFDLPCNQ